MGSLYSTYIILYARLSAVLMQQIGRIQVLVVAAIMVAATLHLRMRVLTLNSKVLNLERPALSRLSPQRTMPLDFHLKFRESIYISDSDESAASFDSLDSLEKAQSRHYLSISAWAKGLTSRFWSRHYDALPQADSLRLLNLLPGKGASKIACTLTTAGLSDNPTYEALSYTWGNPKFPWHSISLNGKDFSVRDNLFWALLYLRHPTEERTLWVDAICINQEDAQEKSSQVKRMGRIYSQASQVAVWLGRSTSGSSLSIELLHEISESPESSDEAIWEMITSKPNVEWKLKRLLHHRIYWSRLWILQEVILAKNITIYCGKDRLPWNSMAVAMRKLRDGMPYFISTEEVTGQPLRAITQGLSRSLDDSFSIRLESIRSDLLSSPNRDIDLRNLMGICQWCECSVRRDKIYGLLGMFDSTMPVDYRKPLFNVYTDAIQHIRHPSVRGHSDLYDFYTVRFSRLVQKLLGGPITNRSSIVPCFRIKGIFGGTIVGLGEPINREGRPATGRRAYGPLDESEKTKIAELLESFQPQYGEEMHLSSEDCDSHYFSATFSGAQGVSLQVPDALPVSGTVPVAKSSEDTISQSRKFVTSGRKPLMGYAPPSALPGDLLVRFLLSDTSIIIRRFGQDYKFVGRAYIPRQPDESLRDFVSESRMVDHVPMSGSIIGPEDLAVHNQHLDIVLDGETLQFISNYYEFEKGPEDSPQLA
ncbi:hypothetical protein DL771_000848 [Monosporascus sp. 5C6A]|nr:hypothetical protein DL771_000848 [Monosporascus sp. 5C6A]